MPRAKYEVASTQLALCIWEVYTLVARAKYEVASLQLALCIWEVHTSVWCSYWLVTTLDYNCSYLRGFFLFESSSDGRKLCLPSSIIYWNVLSYIQQFDEAIGYI